MRHISLTVFGISLVIGCGDGGARDSVTTAGISTNGISAGTSGDGDGDSNSSTGPVFDMGNDEDSATGSADDGIEGDCGPQELPVTDAVLTGTVYAPNMELPISGALV